MTAVPVGRVRAAMRIADYFAGGPYEMYMSQQPVVLQALETLRDACRGCDTDLPDTQHPPDVGEHHRTDT